MKYDPNDPREKAFAGRFAKEFDRLTAIAIKPNATDEDRLALDWSQETVVLRCPDVIDAAEGNPGLVDMNPAPPPAGDWRIIWTGADAAGPYHVVMRWLQPAPPGVAEQRMKAVRIAEHGA